MSTPRRARFAVALRTRVEMSFGATPWSRVARERLHAYVLSLLTGTRDFLQVVLVDVTAG